LKKKKDPKTSKKKIAKVPYGKNQERRAENSVKMKESEEKVITPKEMLALRLL